jgi:motility quorum-sensing regulator / GCU-specific mRNA interferase toxin
MNAGKKPRYPLADIKAAFADAAHINRTMTAIEGAEDLGVDEQAVVHVIQSLTADDFDKSMQDERDPAIRQDVYKPIVGGRELYVKFRRDSRGGLLLLSFKVNDEGAIREITPT